jgi:hypothetical protein
MFSKRIFASAKFLLVGAILALGKRAVPSVLRVMGSNHDQHFQHYHRVRNRARWPTLRGGRMLLRRHSPHARACSSLVSQSARDLFGHNRLGAPLFVASVHFSTSQAEADRVKIPRILYERFPDTLCYAV